MDWLRKIPIGQYVAGNSGWLRNLDPRLKMGWVVMFLLTPVLAGPIWRIGLVAGLCFLTLFSWLPLRVWWRSFCLVLILAILVGLLAMFLPTGETSAAFSVRSSYELPNAFVGGPSWNLFKLGPLHLGPMVVGPLEVDRRSVELALNTSTLIFTVIHSVNLMLLTTSPEDLVWTMRWFMTPLVILGIPVDRICFQLLLSLRFLPLVQEEFQNLVRSLATRAVNIRKLGLKITLGLVLSVAERLLANILLRAEQGADALVARGGLLLRLGSLKPKSTLNERVSFLNMGSAVLLVVVLSMRGKYGAL
ncbi:energy-coupling factor transporter transmembrane component T family protein [Prochlorococcus sp. MIT 1307]|uniref:energy-coupling factor transporter transmembrane component T family protein n=1 Tax=Prochlorococcus sp. MIT 1307 TaxID=3096219 RepID=UPI002A751497|nr:CbiQ family ECF transporter T component [Prochlorococcus sp. MIT 1307]